MEAEWGESVPLHDRRSRRAAMEASSSQARAETLSWSDVWYRLDEGRGTFSLDALNHRINVDNNMKALQQAKTVLKAVDTENSGNILYSKFKDYYNNELSSESWEREVLTRVALAVQDNPPKLEEQEVFRKWMNLVDYTTKNPSPQDFNWHRILPDEYDRSRLLCYAYYRSELVHPQRVTDWLLNSPVVDTLPNNSCIQLLERCLDAVPKADSNGDGYLEYLEFRRLLCGLSEPRVGAVATLRQSVRRGVLATLPRRERTLKKRRSIELCSRRLPPLFFLLTVLTEITTFIVYAVDMGLPTKGNSPCPIYSPLVYHPERRYQAWRFLTYALIHCGWVDLMINVLVQLLLGVVLEVVHRWRVVVVYVAGVAAASLTHSFIVPTGYLTSASGGVYAVAYAYLINLIVNWRWVERVALQAFIILLLILKVIILGTTSDLGGMVAGILVGVVLLRKPTEQRWEPYCRWFSLTLFLMLFLCGILLHVFLPVPEFFPSSDWSPVSQDREEWMQANGLSPS